MSIQRSVRLAAVGAAGAGVVAVGMLVGGLPPAQAATAVPVVTAQVADTAFQAPLASPGDGLTTAEFSPAGLGAAQLPDRFGRGWGHGGWGHRGWGHGRWGHHWGHRWFHPWW